MTAFGNEETVPNDDYHWLSSQSDPNDNLPRSTSYYSPTSDMLPGNNIFGTLEDPGQFWIWDDSFQST